MKQIKYDKVVRKPFTAVDREKLKNTCEFLTREATVIGKGGKERKFYLSEVATEYLQQYLKSRTDSNQALFVSVKYHYNKAVA